MIKKYPKENISLSCPIAIAEALEEEYKYLKNHKEITPPTIEEAEPQVDNHEEQVQDDNVDDFGLECPECGKRTLVVEGKCMTCKRCGYSKCD